MLFVFAEVQVGARWGKQRLLEYFMMKRKTDWTEICLKELFLFPHCICHFFAACYWKWKTSLTVCKTLNLPVRNSLSEITETLKNRNNTGSSRIVCRNVYPDAAPSITHRRPHSSYYCYRCWISSPRFPLQVKLSFMLQNLFWKQDQAKTWTLYSKSILLQNIHSYLVARTINLHIWSAYIVRWGCCNDTQPHYAV